MTGIEIVIGTVAAAGLGGTIWSHFKHAALASDVDDVAFLTSSIHQKAQETIDAAHLVVAQVKADIEQKA